MKAMKLVLITLILVLSNNLVAQNNYRQQDSEVIKENLKFNRSSKDNLFVIENINGTIDVEGYNGNTVQVEVTKTIYAPNKKALTLGKKEVNLGVYQTDEAIYLYEDSPSTSFNKRTGSFDCNSNHNYNNRSTYQHELNYKVRIPKNTNVRLKNVSGDHVYAKNINGDNLEVYNVSGHVSIENIKAEYVNAKTVSGHMRASNIEAEILDAKTVSGHVQLTNISGQTDAHTVSGNIEISYDENPDENSSYTTTSGNVDVTYRPNLNADMTYVVKVSGEVYKDFEGEELKGVQQNSSPRRSSNSSCNKPCNSSKSEMGKASTMKVGSGGPDLYFETTSGNIYINRS